MHPIQIPQLADKAFSKDAFKLPSSTGQRVLTLDEFIKASLEIYRNSDAKQWTLSERVTSITAAMAGG